MKVFLPIGLAVLATAIAAPSAQAVHLQCNSNLGELNNSGIAGRAELEFPTEDGDRVNLGAGDITDLQVDINATGLEANMLHPQHIHGFMIFLCPLLSATIHA